MSEKTNKYHLTWGSWDFTPNKLLSLLEQKTETGNSFKRGHFPFRSTICPSNHLDSLLKSTFLQGHYDMTSMRFPNLVIFVIIGDLFDGLTLCRSTLKQILRAGRAKRKLHHNKMMKWIIYKLGFPLCVENSSARKRYEFLKVPTSNQELDILNKNTKA